LSALGYPGEFKSGYIVEGVDNVEKISGIKVFHLGTNNKDDKIVSSEGRVVGVSAVDKSLKSAIKKAYKAVNKIKFKDSYFRTDIGESGYLLSSVKSGVLSKVLKLVKINF
jgi:phosphoribosylamine--glycine ligase